MPAYFRLRPQNKLIRTVLKRQRLWLISINRADLLTKRPEQLCNLFVCERHFHSGQPANLKDECDVDWVPRLNMGHNRIIVYPVELPVIQERLDETVSNILI
jgi:hypothetical protein